MGDGGQRHAPEAWPPGKTPYPLGRPDGPPVPVWWSAENLVLTGIRSPDRTARSKSLYRVSYRGPRCHIQTIYVMIEQILVVSYIINL